jgi:hypothetical protein
VRSTIFKFPDVRSDHSPLAFEERSNFRSYGINTRENQLPDEEYTFAEHSLVVCLRLIIGGKISKAKELNKI